MADKGVEIPAAQRPKRVTLQDIADVAGVQKMVVSNALNGKRCVAPATREKILAIAREMNYIPNFVARALTTGRTGVVAIISGPLNEPYYASIVHLLEKHLSDNGFRTMIVRTSREVKDMVNSTGHLAVDGVIAVDMLGLITEFRSHPTIPCVFIGTRPQHYIDNVIIDLSESVHQAIDLMIGSGRRRIAYLVTAQVMARNSEVRARTYLAALQKVSYPSEIINVETDQVEKIKANFAAYLAAHDCPDALLCQNDETAMNAFSALKDAGYQVPDDVLLVGCDGQRYMNYFDPPLSTIEQPIEEICALAWQFLQQRIEKPGLPRQTVTVTGKLLVRKSLGFSPTTP